MWHVPNVIVFVGGAAEGETPLNAFDNALLNAGIGHLNLVKVSSIVPADTSRAALTDRCVGEICRPGAIIPCVLSSYTSSVSGETISACVTAGLPSSGKDYGLIYEHAGSCGASQVATITRQMLTAAFKARGREPGDVFEHTVGHDVVRLGCVVAAALLLRV
jgi:arginine decarboxylase